MSRKYELKNVILSKVKTIVFDVGDVLLDYRWKDMLMDYGLCEEDAIRVGNELFEDPDRLWHVFDLGTKTDEEIIDLFCKKYPKDAKAISWFIRHGEFMHVARPDVWEKVHMLKEQGYGIYLLSNYPESLFKKHTRYADFLDDIDGMMVSYMIKKAKPDRAIYKALCDKYDLDETQCLFFDDRIENVEGAIAYRMQSVQVVSREGLSKDLDIILETK
ncbi:HAD family hydrolase [Lachnobacterium bovis]|uniref:Putative hydrolase of the HAD superfamily n=1 Tax=Lachnobacterium bovis TaxID=140626 RepID=A0A1H9SZA0_9FIRM|nr:HAD family phosphatase [Lachnobacterium bovis]SER90198.1 putative hydrolase of the HAD superfamily [Lachnobacterium bovis]